MSELITVFIVGLFGGIHCVGMCGGIVGMLSMGVSPQKKRNPATLLPILLGYNMGRIAGYTLAGGIFGGIGASLISLSDLHHSQLILQRIAALFMIALGLYLANIWTGLSKIEAIGRHLWKHIEPISRRFIPVSSFSKAVPLGFLWGWLPCGLVYSVLIMTLSAGSISKGATLMLAFGLGTLPNLVAMGFIATILSEFTRKPVVRLSSGVLIIVLGILTLYRSYNI